MPDPATILADPEWLAHRHVESTDSFRFIRMPRGDHSAIPFLADEYLGERETVDLQAEACLSLSAGPSLHFLFHSAFCGSTMLVRSLDIAGTAMGLSEPRLLNDVTGFRQRGAGGREVARLADLSTRLLGRPFGPGEAVVVKPSNVINPLAHLLMALRSNARALFLHAPLETFLVSVAHKGLHCRVWARQLFEGYLLEGAVEGMGFTAEDYFKQSDLQIAALGWLAQHRLFHALSERVGDRLASLDADRMLADPVAALERVSGHYGLALDAAAVATGPAFTRHSKSGAAYSAEARAADYERVKAAHGEEIGMVVAWIEAVAQTAGVSLTAPNPLLCVQA